ncbi:hypothetical protein DCAR_0100625 [Daucus carota subsp. sativus]|uniref:Uncharacterized protein n=1 Tax=Daucus carota subsp. sativus TaxID=79200 RepID=A0A166FT65_DAUCS|nr:PREDICTED: uncharacterized protein LOC108216354 [Daucus carota subsp. sativus]WOG81477.1 hypothetical protein DCAR_0100625 [Daucus carota subsp. sativus]
MKGRKKRTPKKRAPSHNDPHGETGTTDNVVRPNEFVDVSVNDFEQPGGDDIMFNAGGDADDPSRWEYQSEYVHNPFGAGPSGVNNQRGSSGVNNQRSEQNTVISDPGNSAFENPTQFFEWPDPPRQYDCTYCQVLRYIVHIKGQEQSTKLEIHGRIGMVCHGILEISSGDTTAPNREYRTFDFCQKSLSDVKKFLIEYYEDRANTSYATVDDPLLTFYDTLCARSEYDWVFNNDNEAEAQGGGVRPKKRTVVEQRAYCETLTIQDVLPYFHLRQSEAAKLLGLGTTKLKEIVRNAGIPKWPAREVNAKDRAIKKIVKKMNPSNPRKKAMAEKEIQELQKAIADIYAPLQKKNAAG